MQFCVCLCANLRPCIYLGSSLQQQSHHVTIPTFGCYVQWCYVILEEEEQHRDHTSHRPHVVSSSRVTSTAVQLHTPVLDSSTLSPQTHTHGQAQIPVLSLYLPLP